MIYILNKNKLKKSAVFSIKSFKFANRYGFLLLARHTSKDFALVLSVGYHHRINCIPWKELITCTIKKR